MPTLEKPSPVEEEPFEPLTLTREFETFVPSEPEVVEEPVPGKLQMTMVSFSYQVFYVRY